jgi:hypothetical protein
MPRYIETRHLLQRNISTHRLASLLYYYVPTTHGWKWFDCDHEEGEEDEKIGGSLFFVRRFSFRSHKNVAVRDIVRDDCTIDVRAYNL